MASGTFSTYAYVIMDPPPQELLDPVAIVAFFIVMFRSGGGAAAFLASASIVVGPPQPELRTCSTVAVGAHKMLISCTNMSSKYMK
jgi:hypothetical protein